MTIKEKLESIKGKKIAIWCEEEWMADKLYTSNGEKSYHNCWFGSDYCVDLEEHEYFSHCDLKWYDDNEFEIITFNDFVEKESSKVELTQQDINQILNDKYGKDNWVIK